MKNLLSVFVAVFLTITAIAQEDQSRGYIVKVGDIAPNFTIKMLDGTEMELNSLRGKVVMLQFTASWCGVCRKEMPFIEKEIWQVHKDKDFAVFGVDRDEPVATVEKFAKQTGVTYPLILDDNADIFALFAERSAGVTRNVIIDRDGKIVYLTRLFNREEFNEMKKKIEELLNE